MTIAECSVSYDLGESPCFGTSCITCGRDCPTDAWRLRARKAMGTKLFVKAATLAVPWCPRCRRRSYGRTVAMLVSAAASAFVGYWFFRNVIGWWPTQRAAQKWLLVLCALPGVVSAYFGWGDPDAPISARQHADRLDVTIESHRCSAEFKAQNPTIFLGESVDE